MLLIGLGLTCFCCAVIQSEQRQGCTNTQDRKRLEKPPPSFFHVMVTLNWGIELYKPCPLFSGHVPAAPPKAACLFLSRSNRERRPKVNLEAKEPRIKLSFAGFQVQFQVMTPTAKTTHTALVGSTDFTFSGSVLL